MSRYEVPITDLGGMSISLFILYEPFHQLHFTGSGATMAGVASPPPTHTSGQTLPHLPPPTVHSDHLISSPAILELHRRNVRTIS
jgi:hypothetical protein